MNKYAQKLTIKWLWLFLLFLILLLAVQTWFSLHPIPADLGFDPSRVRKVQIVDRNYQPLTVTYQNRWNLHETVPLHKIPKALQHAFVMAEDKRFFEHSGVDWWARAHAMLQNIRAGRVVRGASTITEQSVRMLHPRPRTFWSRWLETFEAWQLERHFSKSEILEFYLNQIHYARQRRGVLQAARDYFDRDLDTLVLKEMLALSVLVRSPGRLDLRKGFKEIRRPLQVLAKRMLDAGLINAAAYQAIVQDKIHLQQPEALIQASHFVRYLYQDYATQMPATLSKRLQQKGRLHTTLDGELQHYAWQLLNQRIADLQTLGVKNGAMLIVDHHSKHILAWVNSGDFKRENPGSQIDAVITPRQPGSTLKPLLYALALQQGWTAATLIDDSPLTEAVGTGLHQYHNYSRSYYGRLRLRDALGNSLNIPAVRTAQFVGIDTFLKTLNQLGMNNLDQHPDFYGDGLALGNGEITLLELVGAYATLASQGIYQPLQLLMQQTPTVGHTVFSPEVCSIIADILSDSDARRFEFGHSALLDFPVQTAVKTGTSNDYHDAWAVGFNHRYTVGVWLGNLDRQPMQQVSGATGPALLLRAIFAKLNQYQETQPLYLSPKLYQAEICRDSGQLATQKTGKIQTTADCATRMEWFIAGSHANALVAQTTQKQSAQPILRLKQPVNGLRLAHDPRIPDALEAFDLRLPHDLPTLAVEWLIDGKVIAVTGKTITQQSWPLQTGEHTAQARVWLKSTGEKPEITPKVDFHVF
ncbi:transglycosylase domain-containing protein [Candidatus Venteria ishoeyi]|uniref:transglycosylase domain-containing protein n=1 Tax=Candidatus Venteria ishoeyi TaxID=1899563 RepID=UPI0025A5AA32|nr:transglycosylase domain-containing protein [Candidatus Venteria ishoeyi]MDM8545026.1 transglycosylase domain-containing protein [Candidatus Venteria ishoeyi]